MTMFLYFKFYEFQGFWDTKTHPFISRRRKKLKFYGAISINGVSYNLIITHHSYAQCLKDKKLIL